MLEQSLIARWSIDARIETDRLVIRRFVPADRSVAISHELNREIMADIKDPMPRQEVLERVERLWKPWAAGEGDWLCLCVDTADGETIGLIALRVTVHANETFEIGYRLHPDYHRRGYGLEAVSALIETIFDDLEAHKIEAFCVVENTGSLRLMEKLGMKREACLRQHSRLDGRWRDELIYGLLADDPRPGPKT